MHLLPLRHASRSLRRAPAFSITAVLTLVIGIGAAAAIFAIVNGVLLRPLPYGNPDRLVGAWHDMPPINLHHAQQTASTYFTYKQLAHTIEGIGLYQESAVNVSASGGGSEPQRLTSAWITASLIPVLQVSLQIGRNFTEAEDRPKGPDVVIIGDGLWRSRFGADPRVIGQTMDVNGVTRQIVGVMPARFQVPTAATQIWLPLALDPNDPSLGGFNYNSIARLKPGVSVADAQRDLTAVLPRMVELFPTFAPGVSTQMLFDQAKPAPVLIPLREDMTADVARTLWMVAAAAGLVLLVACFNVANLILVRADGRQRELAVREALGAGRARVLSHFLSEAAVLSAIAGAIGLGVAWLCVRALVVGGMATEAIAIPRLAEVRIDGAVHARRLGDGRFRLQCHPGAADRSGAARKRTARRGTHRHGRPRSASSAWRARGGADRARSRRARGIGTPAAHLPTPSHHQTGIRRRPCGHVLDLAAGCAVPKRLRDRALLLAAHSARRRPAGGACDRPLVTAAAGNTRNEPESVLSRR